jgi:hypothetical protein
MKSFLKLLFLGLLISLPFENMAQTECNPYFVLKKGKKWTTSNYNAKDKYEGKQSFEILDLSESGNNLTAKVMLMSYDKKDELQMEKEIEFVCEDGVIKMDMSQYLPQETMESFKDMEIDMELEDLEIPRNLEVGQYLDEGSVTATISGPMKMKFSVKMTDRKVMDKETLVVPAGTYETYKINSIIKFDAMGMERETKNVEWIAKEVGAVRTESYDKKGKLASYTVLTAYSE